MGFNLIKWILERSTCTSGSECVFNAKDLPADFLCVDLSQYKLKNKDLKYLKKLVDKRPSIHNYKHSKSTDYKIHEI